MKKFKIIAIIILAVFSFACQTSESEVFEKNGEISKELKYPPVSNDLPKIVAFGDSLTIGFGLSKKDSYPYLLQQRIDKEGYKYEVKNLGVSGETSLGGLERIDWVLEQENIEIMILELGANDLLRAVPVERMKTNLDKIIQKAKAKDIEILFCGMLAPPQMGAEYSKNFIAAFPALADKYKLNFVPFLLENVATNPKLNQADGIHPNEKGTKIMMENIYKELKPMLKK